MDFLASQDLPCEVVEFPASTRTAADAAAVIGCTVDQIAKSIIFRGGSTGNPILVVASGVNRVSEETIAALLGEAPGRADAAYVRDQTGYTIGGVPPAGHLKHLTTILDQDLARHDEIWAAAGAPNAVFKTTFTMLELMTSGRSATIT